MIKMSQEKKTSFVDLIRTIGEDEEIEDYSEESDAEVEPSKQKNKRRIDFDADFQFVSSAEEYNKDSWNDLKKYIKRKAKTKTDDKIKKVLEGKKEDGEYEESNVSLSEDELEHDKIKIKEEKKKKKNNKTTKCDEEQQNDKTFFESVDVDTENASFYQMNLSRPLLKAIGEMKFVHPTPIQASTIPVALMGRDICGCAATGTGKTAAYMLPTLERLLYRPSSGTSVTRVLVLVPTRELGVQVYQVTKQLAQFAEIQISLAVGGLDLKAQETILRKNPDIVIATPGRLIDHLKSTPTFGLDTIEILILDEADRMLDEYFAEQMKEIVKQCSRTRQTMLFSATMTDEVENLAAVSLNKPVRLFVDSNKDVAFNLRQEFLRIRQDKEGDREAVLAALVCRTFHRHCMVFVQTKKQAHRLHILLGLLGLKVGELHGNLTQPQRLDALQKFKDEQYDILVATDVAARGLDIHGVQTVINFVMPATLEHYIHRVGRTARAGRAGVSVSLAGEQERKIVKEVVKRAKTPVKSRVIPQDILEKYKKKVEKLEPQVTQIIQEEYEERQIAKIENQTKKLDKMIKGEASTVRPWFQTKKQRKEEKERLSLKTKKQNDKKQGKKRKQKGIDTPEERIKSEVDKVTLLQAKLAKKKHKMKKISTVRDEIGTRKTSRKRIKSNFGDDIWNISKAKKLRYEGTSAKKGKQKGKSFGKPQQKKRRYT